MALTLQPTQTHCPKCGRFMGAECKNCSWDPNKDAKLSLANYAERRDQEEAERLQILKAKNHVRVNLVAAACLLFGLLLGYLQWGAR